MDSSERPLKRTRQACDPCRRKKSRCGGERPACGHCTRLAQRCTYSSSHERNTLSPTHSTNDSLETSPIVDYQRQSNGHYVDHRLAILEAQMTELRQSFRDQRPEPVRYEVPPISAPSATPHSEQNYTQEWSSIDSRLPPWDIVESYVHLFLQHCNYRPLPLFSDNLASTFSSRDPILLLAILALASRFDGNSHEIQLHNSHQWTTRSKELVMRQLVCGPIELSTLQALCLLSLSELNNDNCPQAGMYASLATTLMSSSTVSSEDRRARLDPAHEEHRRAYWSIVLLNCLYGSSTGTISFVHDERTPNYPQSPPAPAVISSQITHPALEQPESANHASNANNPSDLGVVAYLIQLSGIWQKTARYAHRRGSLGDSPAWSAKSQYSQLTAELMESETTMPYKYRFRPTHFADQQTSQLHENRDFWTSWIFLQMLYHTVLCLLNHPLLLAIRLKSFKVTMVPEVFLQHTADMTATHTEWIIHLLDLCEKKDFELFNPFLAHSAAIAATIYLQQSYSEDSTVRATKQDCFNKCVSFIRRLGRYWPQIARLAGKLERFEEVVSRSYRGSISERLPDNQMFIDLTLFWEIIEASFMSELPQTTNPYFGASLTSHSQPLRSEGILRARLLPEPMRLHADAPRTNEPAGTTSTSQLQSLGPSPEVSGTVFMPSLDGEAAILAQNFFALGEDIVGNVDDWWYPQQ